MLKFKKISLKNFLSIGNDPVVIDITDGLNLIVGDNLDKDGRSNGSGKSSIQDSIFFAIYGKTLRGLNKSDVVNKKNKKGTEVILDVEIDDVEYKIKRCVKPSSLQLFRGGKDITRDSINNTQEDITKLIGVSEDVIKNCVIMGINQTIPFMAQSNIDKKKFIEGIFDMGIFSEILKDARADYNAILKELTALESKHEEKVKNSLIYKEQSKNFEKNKKEKLKKQKDIINQKRLEIDKLNKDLNDVNKDKLVEISKRETELKTKRKEVSGKLSEYQTKLSDIRAEIRSLNKSIDNVFTSGVCPVCKKEMTEDDKHDAQTHIQSINDNITKERGKEAEINIIIKKLNDAVDLIDKNIDNILEEKSKINNIITSNSIVQNKIEDCNNYIKNIEQTIDDINKEDNNSQDLLDKVTVEIADLDKNIKEHKKQSEILDQIKFICGENGVKSFIVNKLLDIFNGKINHYLEKLNANCVLTFDEFFTEKIVNDKMQESSYFNFSSGERRNIDIAIMFAFMDLQRLQGKFDTNVLMFDELVDSALDSSGVNYVMDILLNICETQNKSIYLITHRKELQSVATGSVIKIVKQNGISELSN